MEPEPTEHSDIGSKRKHRKKSKKHSRSDSDVNDDQLPQLVNLSEDHRSCLRALKTRVENLSRGYDPDLQQWSLDTLCLLRYLRARNYSVDKAEKMIGETLRWRAEFQPDKIACDDVKDVLALGTLYQNGRDKEGRPLLFIKPGAYNPHTVELKVKTMIYTLESAISTMDRKRGVEKMVWFMDFTDYGSRARSPDGRKVAQTCLSLLQDHYPERLGLAFIINPPWWVSLLFTLLSPFMDSVTKAKIHFLHGDSEKLHSQLTDFIDDEQLERCYGGLLDAPKLAPQ